MSQCKIALDNYNGQYYAGGTIAGKVECYFDHDIKIRAVKIRVRCLEHNEWTDSEEYLDPSDNKYRTRWVVYSGDKDAIFMEQILYNSDGHPLIRGRHVFPFTIDLPEEIPSTFNGSYGGIRWEMIAVVDIPMAIDYEDFFTFIVFSPIDLNRIQDSFFHETNYSDEKTICCWCCKGGSVTMDVEMPKLAFVPGEEIPLRITICNMSNESIEGLKVNLERELKFIVNVPSYKDKFEYENLGSIAEHGVGAHGEHTYDIRLVIPNYQEIPNFALCSLFQSNYYIKINAQTGTCSTDLDITIYPEIGHIQRGQTYNFPGNQAPDINYQQTNGGYPTPPTGAYPPPEGMSPYPPAPIGTNYPPPPAGVNYPPPSGEPYSSPGGGYPPSAATNYPPPFQPSGNYPPPGGATYPPPAGPTYPPPAGSTYPPPAGSTHPPPAGPAYPPPAGSAYPPSSGPGYPSAPGGVLQSGSTDKPVYPGGPPNAPNYSIGPNSKAAEASQHVGPSAPPPASELPPPSYTDVQKNNPPYPPFQ